MDPPAAGLEEWVALRLPYVEPARLLACARLARREGRHRDAVGWIEEALHLSPAQSAEFLACLQDLGEEQGRDTKTSPRAHRQIGALVHGREWLLHPTHRDGEEFCRSLVASAAERCVPGRLALASWTHEGGGAYPPGGSLLDQATALYQQAMALGRDRVEDALGLLDQASRLAPPAAMATRIHGARWCLLVLDGAPFAALREALAPGLSDQDRFLPHLDRGLEQLAAREDPSALLACLQELGPAFAGHAYRARLQELEARVTADPVRRRALLEWACSERRPLPSELPVPRILAWQELSRLAEQGGHWREAAELAARALIDSEPRDAREIARILRLLLRAGCRSEAENLRDAALSAVEDLSTMARTSIRDALEAPFSPGDAADNQ